VLLAGNIRAKTSQDYAPVDTTNHIVYGEVNSLSWFFIGGEWLWIDDGGGTRHAPAFPSLYLGIGAALETQPKSHS